ncbi:RNA-directed DNA polymerase, eukaryota, reverse transcriptase zinc-binding domain protein [Tanacetum coccineum]
MVKWIMTCVRTSKFSICVNGEAHGYFNGGRGLRQGDPISPYLFTLVIEVFSLLLANNIQKARKFKFHYVCKDLKLTNMCFADDLLVLCNGDIGSLPMKYLGVPLIAKSLGINDCKSLVMKVAEKINWWKNKVLTYAGRIQLIASVLSSMRIYWASVYMLPSTTIKEIERLLKGFLWCQCPLTTGKAKVAWKKVCLPKEQGGKESLWVKWVNVVKLKGNSIWDIEETYNDSCGWKKLLELRNKIKKHVFYSIGNGRSVSIWFDIWDVKGHLCDFIPRRDWYSERYSDNEIVADMINNGVWVWPSKWYNRYHVLRNINIPNLSSGMKDKVYLLDNQNEQKDFSAKQVWIDLRENNGKVEWHHVKVKDSHDHLFFKCKFAEQVWGKLRDKMGKIRSSYELKHIVMDFSQSKAKRNLGKVINRLVLAAAVYYIWQERNWRIFKQEKRSVEQMLKIIIENVKMRIMSFKVNQTRTVIKVTEAWNLKWKDKYLIAV